MKDIDEYIKPKPRINAGTKYGVKLHFIYAL